MTYHLAIVGGDARYYFLWHYLRRHGCRCTLIGYDQLEESRGERSDEPCDAAIFPVQGVREDGLVQAVFATEPLVVQASDIALSDKGIVYSGLPSRWLQRHFMNYKTFADDEQFALRNALPTVEGIFFYCLQQTTTVLHHSTMIVAGYGRIGSLLAHKLQQWNVSVIVVTNDDCEATRAELQGFTVQPLGVADGWHRATCLINTIPVPHIRAEQLAQLPRDCFVLDVASHPGGFSGNHLATSGLNYQHILSIPSLIAPKFAGEQIGRYVLHDLQREDGSS